MRPSDRGNENRLRKKKREKKAQNEGIMNINEPEIMQWQPPWQLAGEGEGEGEGAWGARSNPPDRHTSVSETAGRGTPQEPLPGPERGMEELAAGRWP